MHTLLLRATHGLPGKAVDIVHNAAGLPGQRVPSRQRRVEAHGGGVSKTGRPVPEAEIGLSIEVARPWRQLVPAIHAHAIVGIATADRYSCTCTPPTRAAVNTDELQAEVADGDAVAAVLSPQGLY